MGESPMKLENYHLFLKLVDCSFKEIKDLRNHCIILHFFFEDMNPENGRKVRKLVELIEKKHLGLFLTFVPPCIFKPNRKSLKLFLYHDQTPVFTLSDLGVTQVITKEDMDLIRKKGE